MRRAFFLVAVCLLVCSVASCKPQKLPVKTVTIRTASGNDITVAAELAVTDEQRQRGFMERRTIPDGTGMLFVFENDQILRFWMKNTPHPLSIAYIGRDGTIRDIFDMTPFSLASVVSTVSVRYALEVPQGWFAKAGVRTGDVVLFP
ncbi:MAG: DUF192 domain-containing protein [Treponemataceae bacterium]|nr:DUF192 domain-containing protein [Treponemataceae bacterium]